MERQFVSIRYRFDDSLDPKQRYGFFSSVDKAGGTKATARVYVAYPPGSALEVYPSVGTTEGEF